VKHREIFDVSNLDERGAILDERDARSTYRLGNQLWHTDSSFRQKSAAWSMLHARVIPPDGGDTEFADTRAAYDALPDTMKSRPRPVASTECTRAENSAATCRPRRSADCARRRGIRWCAGIRAEDAMRPIASHASHIVGMPVEGRALLGNCGIRDPAALRL
jgi:alpha-ketoglutarate-dependent 2,4-dichlorophenoxyacetate dioxygenase